MRVESHKRPWLAAVLLVACTSAPRNEALAGSAADSPLTGGSAAPHAGSGATVVEPMLQQDAALELDAQVGPHDAGHDAAPATDASVGTEDGATDAAVDAGEPVALYSTKRHGAAIIKMQIDKSVPQLGYCVQLTIAWPSSGIAIDEIDMPEPWALYSVLGIETVGECEEKESNGVWTVAREALSARGRIAWRDPGPYDSAPCSIDVDIEVTFAATDRIPTVDRLLATDLPVECESF